MAESITKFWCFLFGIPTVIRKYTSSFYLKQKTDEEKYDHADKNIWDGWHSPGSRSKIFFHSIALWIFCTGKIRNFFGERMENERERKKAFRIYLNLYLRLFSHHLTVAEGWFITVIANGVLGVQVAEKKAAKTRRQNGGHKKPRLSSTCISGTEPKDCPWQFFFSLFLAPPKTF